MHQKPADLRIRPSFEAHRLIKSNLRSDDNLAEKRQAVHYLSIVGEAEDIRGVISVEMPEIDRMHFASAHKYNR